MSLQGYLKEAYKQVRLTSHASLSSVEGMDAELQPARDNLILVYGGSFNPPHRGHIEVLLSSLRPEVSPAAVVVLPSENFHLRNKLAKNNADFFLSRQRRADLLNAIPSLPRNMVWVWPSTWYPFLPFTEAVVNLAKDDGFCVAFCHLIGPDNLNSLDPLMNLPYRLPRILVTNRARHLAAQFTEHGSPKIWPNFGKWSRANRAGKYMQQEDGQEEVVLWACNGVGARNQQEERVGYYLVFSRWNSTDINSTALRKELSRTCSLDEDSLNKLSTGDLLKLITPFLERGGCAQAN